MNFSRHSIFLYAFVVGVCFPGIANASDDPCLDKGAWVSSDPNTARCYSAYCTLPQEDRLSEASSAYLESHIAAHKDVFKAFLEACFLPYDKLYVPAPTFLADIYGALFYNTRQGPLFVCSGFRLSQTVVLTARHCIYDGDNFDKKSLSNYTFRLISHPNIDIPVISELPNAGHTPPDKSSNDFDDYWYLTLDKNNFPFTKGVDNYRNQLANRRDLLVGGVNAIAYVLETNDDASKWASAYRFSRVAGAQWFPGSQLKPPSSPEADKKCIYYKATTFGGMSGAPIISAQVGPDGKPQTLFVVGIHLRGGAIDAAHPLNSDCGVYNGYNIALALPSDVLEYIAAAQLQKVNKQ